MMDEGTSHQASPAPTVPAKDARPRPSIGSILFRYARLLTVAYLVVLLLTVLFENSLIFFPSVYPKGNWQPAGLKFEDAWFEADDGTELHGWYVPHDNPRAVVLFAHGNAGNLSDRADVVSELVRGLGASVMIFDYRGYGRSKGKPNEEGVLEDARAARRWLAKRAGVNETDIVLYGESLGGGVMVQLAATDGARALVLENTFSSLADVAAFHYSWLPVRLLMRSQLNSAAKIRDYHGPLLQVHGDADKIIPLSLAERLFAAANEPKRLVIIPHGDHNDSRTGKFYQAFDEFLAELTW